MQYNYVIKPLAVRRVRSFYWNVSRKYPNIYSYEDMLRYINKTVDAIYYIEQTALRRRPTIERWKKWHMAQAGHWYYAYSIDGNTITIHDACHAQNMKF
jgi:hypothetical protein